MSRIRQATLTGAVLCLVAGALACERAIAPRRNRLADLRSEASSGLGNFFGRVVVWDETTACYKPTVGVPGVTVELGLWDGIPAFYRDTITKVVPTTLAEPRFQFLSSTTTDNEGRFSFVDVPRGFSYAVRVVPPRNSPWKVAYGQTLYGPPSGRDVRDFPSVCLRTPPEQPG